LTRVGGEFTLFEGLEGQCELFEREKGEGRVGRDWTVDVLGKGGGVPGKGNKRKWAFD